MKRSKDKIWGYGLLLTIFGAAGMAEHITSGRGIFMVSAIVFSIGFALILTSYRK